MKLLSKLGVGIFLTSLIFVSPVFSETSVNVSANGSGSDSHVTVNNSVNATSNSVTSSQNCHTTVTVNGKTYTSDNCGDMNVQSDDGHSSVVINHNSTNIAPTVGAMNNGSITSVPTPDVTKTQQEAQAKIKAQQEKIKKQMEDQQKKMQEQQNFIQKFFEEQISQIKSLFAHLF